MITKVIAKGFKGIDFELPLGKYNLFIGPNGAGKSARTQALVLAVLGYLPSDGKKQPGAIFDIHSSGDEGFSVGFETEGGRTFARHYKRDGAGAVSMTVSKDGKKIAQKQIERALIDTGDPKVFDLGEFMALSDQRKVDAILSLSPPSGDLSKTDEEIETLTSKESGLRSNIKAASLVIERLTTEKAALDLPSGTLAEIRGEIGNREKTLEETRRAIRSIEIEAEKEKARAAAKAEADRLPQSHPEAQDSGNGGLFGKTRTGDAPVNMEPRTGDSPGIMSTGIEIEAEEASIQDDSLFAKSLLKIKETMLEAGCETCAAMIVINAELRKWGGTNGRS